VKIEWSGRWYTNALKALDVLKNYIEAHSNFSSADHVALFSGSVKHTSDTYYYYY